MELKPCCTLIASKDVVGNMRDMSSCFGVTCDSEDPCKSGVGSEALFPKELSLFWITSDMSTTLGQVSVPELLIGASVSSGYSKLSLFFEISGHSRAVVFVIRSPSETLRFLALPLDLTTAVQVVALNMFH
jgi:hypothetical protein